MSYISSPGESLLPYRLRNLRKDTHPFLWTTGFILISQEMRYGLKIGKKDHFSQFGQDLTQLSWQPLLLLKLQASCLGCTTPESKR